MKNILLLMVVVLCGFVNAEAQKYSFKQLLQEQIVVTTRPQAANIKDSKDTSYTVYGNCSVPFTTYMVYGEEYDPVMNPNPTGIFINGKHFSFYCGSERSMVKYLTTFLDIYEFKYLNRKYLCFFALREDCLTQGCRFRCYNVFDITDPKNILAYSFTSIYGGEDSFGDYNNDGVIDFISAAPKSPESYAESEQDDKKSNVLITAYSFDKEEVHRLEEGKLGNPYYMYVAPFDEDINAFKVIKSDWFVTLKDSAGTDIKPERYYPEYEPFDPKNDFLYNVRGHRVDKRSWVVHLADYDELDGALDYCEKLKEANLTEAYIKIDQYGRTILFQVLYGNYWGKEKIEQIKKILDRNSVAGKVKNLRNDF